MIRQVIDFIVDKSGCSNRSDFLEAYSNQLTLFYFETKGLP